MGVGVVNVSRADRVKLLVRLQTADYYIRAKHVLYPVSYLQRFLGNHKTLSMRQF